MATDFRVRDLVGKGSNNIFENEYGFSPHSLLTQQQLMLGGHKFRQLVNIDSKTVGTNAGTVAGAFQVLGMKSSVGLAPAINQSASSFTLDSLFCTDVSTAILPINNEIDVYFHGVSLQFQPNVNWVARINFGVPFARTVPFAGQPVASGTEKQWGVEFYYSGGDFYGRLYYYFESGPTYGDPFILPLYTGATSSAWAGFIYSIRMRQVPFGTRRLRLEFYINDSVSNSGGDALSKTTPLAFLETVSIPALTYKFSGKHINFEAASSSTAVAGATVRIQSSNMYCQFK